MNKKPLLKIKEKVILQYIDSKRGFVTAHNISKATGLSYVTVRKYCDKLIKEGILISYHAP